jgi:co-chaperonin GroES (HSP10)
MGKSTAKVSGFELKSADEFKQEEKAASQLPEPQGYKILIAIPNPEETTEGGIIKSSQTLENERVSSVVGLVLALGKDAYADEKRFPNGPYCKEGDLILMRAYSGTRIKIHGKEFRLINDDSVEAKIDDPRGIQRL